MNATSSCAERQRGQALPLALAGLFAAAAFFAFALRSTERLVQRERVRARADVSAFSGGVSYARALNFLAASQKAVALGWVITVFDSGQTRRTLQRLQALFLKVGPWYSQGITLSVAHANGLVAVPVWNQDVLFEGLQPTDLMPSYNVAPFTVSDAVVEGMKGTIDKALQWFELGKDSKALIQQGLDDLAKEQSPAAREEAARLLDKHGPRGVADELVEISHYEYSTKDGRTVRVEKEDAGQVWENDGRGGKRPRYKAGAKHKHKYVRAVPTLNMDLQLSLDEGQPHMITLFALQGPQPRGQGERRPGTVLALSQVRVAGGSQSLVDPEGSGYGAMLVPVRLFAADGGRQAKALGPVQKVLNILPLPHEAARWAQRSLDLAGTLHQVQH